MCSFKLIRLHSIFLAVLVFSEIHAIPATDELDSLFEVVSTQEDGIEKVNTIIEIAMKYARIDLDSAMMFAEQAFALSNQLDYDKGRLDALFRKGYIQKKKGNYNTSFEYFTEFLALSEKIQDSGNMAKGYLEYAIAFRRMGKEELASYYHKKSISIYLKLNHKWGLLSNYNSLGNLFKSNAQFDSAAYYYMQAININKEVGSVKNLIIIYHNLGGTYKELQDYENARKYLFMALNNTEDDDKDKLSIIYTKLGNVSNEEMYLDSALFYYKLAEPLCRDLRDLRGLSDLYMNYGIVFEKKGLYDLAYHNYNLALKYYKEQNLSKGIIKACQRIAEVYSKRGNYNEALMLLDSCYQLSKSTNRTNERLSILLHFSEIYYESGNYRLSYDYFNKYNNLKDSIYMLEKEEIIADLRIQYDRELDQAKILALENENLRKTKQRNTYFFTGLTIIGLGIFLLLYLRLTARKNRIIAEQRIRQLEEEKKLLAAKFLVEGQEEERKRIAQELHDGLGVLLSTTKMQFSSIKDKSPENKSLIERATKLLEQASGDVRKISHNMMPGLLTKLGLCEAVEDLFERLNETEGISAHAEITGGRERLPENKEIMMYRIVQEMVNNTLKHAEAKHLGLVINVLPEHLDILYTDDGKGFDVAEQLESKSLGLQSIQSRVNFLEGQLQIESSPEAGTKYTMLIPT